MHHDSTKFVSVAAHGQIRECKLPPAPGEVPVDVFSDRGSIPLGSTTHSHVQWEISETRVGVSFAALTRVRLLLASIAITGDVGLFF